MNEKMNEQGEEKYLAVDFSINLEIGSRNRDDIYRESLKEQFKKIQRKLKLYGKEEIELSINSIPFITKEVNLFVIKSPTKNISNSSGIIDERAIVFSGLIYILQIAL